MYCVMLSAVTLGGAASTATNGRGKAADPATSEADARKVDYRAALDPESLRGTRIGVMRFLVPNFSQETQAEFERALQAKRPAARYGVTKATHLMAVLRRILPQPMLDWALNKASDQ